MEEGRVEHRMRVQKKKEETSPVSSTTTDDDEEEEDKKRRRRNSATKPRKDSGIHSMNSSSSPVASDKDIGVSRYDVLQL